MNIFQLMAGKMPNLKKKERIKDYNHDLNGPNQK